MRLRISRLLAFAAFAVAGLLGSAQTLAQNAYIPSQLDNTVSVISTATNTVTAVINDPSFNMPDSIAVTPDGHKVYVANCVGDKVSVIHTATNTVTTIKDPSFSEAVGVAVTPDGRTVYVVNNGPNFDGNTVSVIDTGTNTVTETITLPDGKGPNAVAVLCQEGARAPCCTRDEGGPFGAVL